ncbi:hypothetical protein SUDANB70_05379 [Streptomyces sp. enrichment culture]
MPGRAGHGPAPCRPGHPPPPRGSATGRRARPPVTTPAAAGRAAGRPVRPGPYGPAPAAQASVIESPSTLMGTDASGSGAGPPCTLPSVIEKLLLWQGQLMTPSATLCTAQP